MTETIHMTEQAARKLAAVVAQRLAARLAVLLMQRSQAGRRIVIHLRPGTDQVQIEWPPVVDSIRAED